MEAVSLGVCHFPYDVSISLKYFPHLCTEEIKAPQFRIGDLLFKKAQASYSSSILDFQIEKSNFHYKAFVNNLLFQLFLFHLLIS